MNMITKLALSNDKKNKTRSVLVMVAIFLTTMLLTVICIFGNGMIKTQKVNAGSQYGTYYGIYNNLNAEQLQAMERRSEFSEIGKMASAGMIQHEKTATLFTLDETTLKLTNLDKKLTDGQFPQKADEIAAQPAFFESLGYPDIKIGDKITISYRPDLSKLFEDKEFVVSGIIADNEVKMTQKAYAAYCSKAFYEQENETENRRYSAYFRLNESVPITTDDSEEVIKGLAEECGIDKQMVSANGYYLMWSLDPGMETISMCVIIIICVILFSVVVIYNIFQVGLAQKIQEYGKIKALGATKKQMRRLIYREGMFLTIPSIPAGLLIGYLVAWMGFDIMMSYGSTVGGTMERAPLLSVPMLLLSGLLALITVMLALRKPMRIVASVSPVEAIRYQESKGHKKSGLRKGKNEVSVVSMAMANITGNRKRTMSTIFTMGLSCVLFVIIANWTGNIDVEYDARKSVIHGQFQIELNYSRDDEAYPENNLENILKDNPLNEELIEDIKAIPGVTDVQTRIVMALEVNGKKTDLSVINKEDFEKSKSASTGFGTLDYKEASKVGNIYYGWSSFVENNLDEKISFKLDNGSETISFDSVFKGSFGHEETDWIITEDVYKAMNVQQDSLGFIWVDCKDKDFKEVQQTLETLLAEKEHIEVSSFQEAMQVSKMSSSMMKIMCYLFLAIFGLIGFMNLANTMIISIITKKQEYGILQAVGMTNRQMNQSLQLQGIIFTAGTIFTALVIGLPVGYGIFKYAKGRALFGLNIYHVPYLEIGAMIAIIAVLQFGLAFLLSRNIKKESLVERIRYQG